jgi:OmpA-OmpF porin, OOP family
MEAEDADNFKDEDGCPDPDNDGDGVLDAADQCPDQLETANGYQDDDGCPDDVPKAIKKFTGVIKGINFKTNSDVILKSSNKTLDAALKILVEYPDLKLEIQGHTDDVGDHDYNVDLSQRRADSVKRYFVEKGVTEDRLIAKGYGPDAPLLAKKTKAARAKNRRVEFKLVSDLTSPPPAAPPEPAPATQPTEPAPAPAPETQPTPPPSNP